MAQIYFRKLLILICIVFFAYAGLKANEPDTLWANFISPPQQTKPAVYWYWISDHISKEGISRDLEAMAAVGIGEAFVGNIDQIEEKGNVKVLSEEWWQLVEFAIEEGARTGIDIGFFNAPGWSQSGGPWIKPSESMRYLVTEETSIEGPASFNQKLTTSHEHFEDVAILAFQAPLLDNKSISGQLTGITTHVETNAKLWFDEDPSTESFIPGSEEFTITLHTESEYTIRSLTFLPAGKPFRLWCKIEAKNADGNYRTVKQFEIDRSNTDTSVGFIPFGAVAETFPATSAKEFKLTFYSMSGNPGFTEIILSGAARAERYIEKQLGRLCPNPSPQWDTYMWQQPTPIDDPNLTIPSSEVLNISHLMDSEGNIKWQIPEGKWIIQRIGMIPTGVLNRPASPEATGLEVDKMNALYVENHFNAYLGRLLNRLPSGHRLTKIIADSYETGAQNWTTGMEEDFRNKFGYDPIPWLPVLTGRVVGSADLSDRFLWDLRRMVADKISYEYVGTLRRLANENNLELWLENYGHWGYPGEFLQYGGQSDHIAGEFWTGDGNEGRELRAASSASHTYGKNVIAAEAFTSGGPAWHWNPRNLKKKADWAATKGINHFVMHVYIHQPYETMVPGINAWFGIEFNRHNTWFSQSKDWIDYIRRTHYLLQQGLYVADVAYFTGEDAPKMTGPDTPPLPQGYNFDYINADVIETRLDVKDGRFVLPDGMSYKLLVLPPQATMRPSVLKKIEKLIALGGIVVGHAPQRSPSMENFPVNDNEIQILAREIWKNIPVDSAAKISYGKGWVYNGFQLEDVFSDIGLLPDIQNINNENFPWIHRKLDDLDIYFISNQTDFTSTITPSFRVDGMIPEIWEPNLQIREPLNITTENGTTSLSLEFDPGQSYFVVFRKAKSETQPELVNYSQGKTIYELENNWEVHFNESAGGPGKVSFTSLTDWSQNENDQIKFYSGTATYKKKFNLRGIPKNQRIYINLGEFQNLAKVKLNGKHLGTVWAKPFILDITDAVKRRNNILEIEITNNWHNRLVGDASIDEELRTTSTIIAPNSTDKLQPAGLFGPVLIQINKKAED